MPTDQLIHLTADLRALGGQRVWSLMVSLFGDLVQEQGAHIDGPVLSAIMAAMQIKPEAARVALHRLRNDGWLISKKQGRISQHSLSEEGLRLSAEASPRIYATPDETPQDWQLVMLKHAGPGAQKQLETAGYAQVMPRIYVGGRSMAVPKDALVLQGADVPPWLQEQITPEHLTEGYEKLCLTLTHLTKALPNPSVFSPLEVAVLRCLVVHNWRRLVLKHPSLPRALIADNWAGHRCHLQVFDLLNRFPCPPLGDIQPR